ncbi:MAG: hypothetical protein IT322_04120 [Anaerolineae bacterium]|nr:hypothetical protein [Anaerolineae bacterium]
MNETLQTRLKSLSEAVGVSGDESEVRKLILEQIKDQVSSVIIDAMGSITARKAGTSPTPLRLMIAAHMDEIGFMITGCDSGIAQVMGIGDHDARFSAAKRVSVGSGKTPGVLLWAPIHKSYGQKSLPEPDDMTIDLGAGSAAVGDRAAYQGQFAVMGEHTLRGKALESRAPCAVLIDLLLGDALPVDLLPAFTVQHHIGARGARTAAYRLRPDAAIVLRAVECNDLPPEGDRDSSERAAHFPLIRLGGGPALVASEAPYVTHRNLFRLTRELAQQAGIPYQIDALNLSHRTEGEVISATAAGIPTITIGIPVRYSSSPNGLVDVRDLEHTAALLRVLGARLTAESLQE